MVSTAPANTIEWDLTSNIGAKLSLQSNLKFTDIEMTVKHERELVL